MTVDVGVILVMFAIFVFSLYVCGGVSMCIKRLDRIMEMLREERLDKLP